MLTRGQAACIILDLKPTTENRELAKKSLEASLFDVVHTDTKHADPFPIAKVFIEKTPAKYKTYPDTPPPSPRLLTSTPLPSQSRTTVVPESRTETTPNKSKASAAVSVHKRKGVDGVTQERSTVKTRQKLSGVTAPKEPTLNSKPDNLITALRSDPSIIIKVAKVLFVKSHKLDSPHRLVYATDQFIYDILEKHIPISKVWTVADLVKDLHQNEDHFEDYDQILSMRGVRLLYMVKENYQARTVKRVLYELIPNLCIYF